MDRSDRVAMWKRLGIHILNLTCAWGMIAPLLSSTLPASAASAPRECMGDFATVDSDEAQSNCWRFGKVTK
jgi:hypothetical protein